MSFMVQSEGPCLFRIEAETSSKRVELKRREEGTNKKARIEVKVPFRTLSNTARLLTECLFRQICLFSKINEINKRRFVMVGYHCIFFVLKIFPRASNMFM